MKAFHFPFFSPFNPFRENRLVFGELPTPKPEAKNTVEASPVDRTDASPPPEKGQQNLNKAETRLKRFIQMEPIHVKGRVEKPKPKREAAKKAPQPPVDVSTPQSDKTLAEIATEPGRAALEATVNNFLQSNPSMKGEVAQLVRLARASQNEGYLVNALNTIQSKISSHQNFTDDMTAIRTKMMNDRKKMQST